MVSVAENVKEKISKYNEFAHVFPVCTNEKQRREKKAAQTMIIIKIQLLFRALYMFML